MTSATAAPPLHFLITPHPKAPLFANRDAHLILTQAITEITSNNFHLNDEIMQVFRQAGLVNLFFLVKYVWGVDGEYDRLSENLHLEVCNFTQSIINVGGARGIVILSRGHAKSRCATEGGSGWGLLRDPSKCYKILNATDERAFEFRDAVRTNFQGEFFKAIYPEISVTKIGKFHVLVNGKRVRYRREENLAAGGVMGSPEGEHFDGLFPDDIYGGKLIDAMHMSGAEMEKTRQKFNTNQRALLNGPAKSFVLMCGTRWGVDDGYKDQLENMQENCGSPVPGDFNPVPKGRWKVYYRDVIEDGKPIWPEEYPMEELQNIEETDPWTWWVQYRNNPYAFGIAEFVDSKLKKFVLNYDEKQGYYATYFSGGEEVNVKLSKGMTLAASDPAASEKKMDAKTSRTALVNLTRMSDERKFVFGVKAGYVPVGTVEKDESDRLKPSLYNWVFDNAEKYHTLLSKTVLETQGPFKLLGPLFRREQQLREMTALKDRKKFYSPKLTPVSRTLTDKEAVIRSVLQPELDAGRIYVEESCFHLVAEEVRGFPTAKRKDILDAICLAIMGSYRPTSEDEEVELIKKKNRFASRRANICGM